MNTNTPYEHSIAAKLEQIPVPDMADSIWASIDMQLNADMEVPDKKSTPKIKGKGWYGFAAITVAVTALWFYTHRTTETPKNIIPQKQMPVPEVMAPAVDSPSVQENTEKKTLPIPQTDSIAIEEKPDSSRVDSIVERVFPIFKPDSSFLRYDRSRLSGIDTAKILAPPKKVKGVKGISSDDYKISVEKDSNQIQQ